MNTKRSETFFTSMFALIFSINLVSAGPVDGLRILAEGLGEMLMIIVEFFGDLILNLDSFSNLLFAKLLLLILIYLVVFTVIGKNRIFGLSDKKGKDRTLLMIISAAIAILSTRFLEDELVEAILIQYSTLGVALTIFLPLMIYFFFVHQSEIGPFGRRAAWALYFSILIGLWIFQSSAIGFANYIYLAGLVFVILAFFFDKTIHDYFQTSDLKKRRSFANREHIRNIKRKIAEADEDLAEGRITEEEHSIVIDNYNRRIKSLSD